MIKPISNVDELKEVFDKEVRGNNLMDWQLALFASAIIDKGEYAIGYDKGKSELWKLPVASTAETDFRIHPLKEAVKTTFVELTEDAAFFAYRHKEDLRDAFNEEKTLKEAATLAKQVIAADKVSDVLDMIQGLTRGIGMHEIEL